MARAACRLFLPPSNDCKTPGIALSVCAPWGTEETTVWSCAAPLRHTRPWEGPPCAGGPGGRLVPASASPSQKWELFAFWRQPLVKAESVLSLFQGDRRGCGQPVYLGMWTYIPEQSRFCAFDSGCSKSYLLLLLSLYCRGRGAGTVFA